MKQKEQAPPALRIPDGIPEDFVRTPPEGLTAAEAQRRAAAGEDNRAPDTAQRSVPQIIAANLFTFFNLLNFALAACLLLVRSYRNMLFMGVVLSNTLIGTVQEIRARRMVSRLRVLEARDAAVIRDGRETGCPAAALVRGDLVVLRAGDQVPADAIVTDGKAACDESLLTGESDPETKTPGDWLLSGTFLTEGRVTAQLVHVGEEAYAARLTKEARQIRRPRSALMSDLNRLIRWVSVLLVPIGLLLFAKQTWLLHAEPARAVPTAVAAMVGMIPEGLLLLTSVALMAGVVKLGRRRALVQEMHGIETLARVDVLCLDKTGTLTTGEMTVSGLIPLEADEAAARAALRTVLTGMEPVSGTARALLAWTEADGSPLAASLPFSSQRKYTAVQPAGGKTLILGAPSFVLRERWTGPVRERAEAEAARGARVLLLAESDAPLTGDAAPLPDRCLALLCLQDTLRTSAGETLAYFRQQGVTVKIISGDDPRTVSRLAVQAGLENAENAVDCTGLSEEELRQAADRNAVFGRVTPAGKQILVEALKAAGHTVAMTGDGVNDLPALKASDCSIGLGSGTDAARNASQLVLLDSDFSVLPGVVSEGRRVINNITRVASLFLVKTLYSFLLSLLTLALPLAYPFQPVQLTLISSLTIGIPSFFLALQPSEERITGSFLRKVLYRALPGAAAVAFTALAAMVLERFGVPQPVCSTLAVIGAGIIGLATLARNCLPFDRYRLILTVSLALVFAAVIAFLPGVCYLTPRAVTLPQWGLLALTLAASAGLAALIRRLMRRRAHPDETEAQA